VAEITPGDAYAWALGFLRAGGHLALSEYVRLAPEVKAAFQRAGTALLAEKACAIARACSSPHGFAEVQAHFDALAPAPEGLVGEALLDEHMWRELAGRAPR
jgi:hypothetical protein